MLHYIVTQSGDNKVITIVLSGKPVTVSSADPYYEKVLELIKTPDATEEAVAEVIFGKAREVEAAILGEDGFSIVAGVVTYEGMTLPAVLSERIISMAREGFDVSPLKRFVENLVQNPSSRVFQQLYSFLEKGKLALTEDGCFLAYKKVRSDYRDIHSGTFDNSVGATVEVLRILVDDDPEETCSHGLHVCSYDYLAHFGSSIEAGSRVVVCKVNPRDVVAVPKDYAHTKMRVCKYTVVSEVSDYVANNENILQASSVMDGSTFETYAVQGRFPYSSCWETVFTATTLSAAFERYLEERENLVNEEDAADTDYVAVRVINLTTDAVLESTC